ncbi:FAD-binding protein [Chloroflexota bacterium]
MAGIEPIKTEVVSSDVLVIGGGIAACCAAIKAKECGSDVVLVDKGTVGRSGLSPCMSGILTCFDPQKDDEELVYKERVENGVWLADQECLDNMNQESWECIKELESFGAKFQKDTKGEYIRKPGVGATHGRNVSMVHGGIQLMTVLRGEVLKRGVHVIERVMVSELLTSDGKSPTKGRIVGAVGFNVRTGKFYVFKAKAVIIATGGALSIQVRCVHPHCSGDGLGMAFRAGAEVRNMDVLIYSPRLRDFKGPIGPGLHIFAMEDVHYVNANGERFVSKWDKRGERADRATIGKAWFMEEKEGRGPIYTDATHLDVSAHDRIEKAMPLVIHSLNAIGQSFRKDKIPYTTDLLDEEGGIRLNKEAAATIPGLYAAGDVGDAAYQGCSEPLSPGMGSAIYAYRAGKAAAKYCAGADQSSTDEQQVQLLKEKIFAPMTQKAGLNHHEVRAHCRSLLEKELLGPIKNEKNIKQAIAIAKEIRRNEMPKLKAKDYHELARTFSLGSELLFLELIAHCSLARTESRGSHFREDYQEQDDVNWLKWVIAKREDDDIKVWTESIPFDKYRLKP